MARAQQDLQSPFTFVKGLITEANKLNEPENSASDMLNIVVDSKGTASVRNGLQEEEDFEYVNTALSNIDQAVSTIEWKNVNGDPATNFLVLQMATKLFFYDLNALSISSGLIGTADFSSVCLSITDAGFSPIDGSAISLGLVCVNQYADPFIVFYDSEENEFVLSKLTIKIRDFIGLPDGLRIDENPEELSNPHFYNLMNQGWVRPGDSGLLDSSGNGTDGGTPTTGGGTTGGINNNFETVPL